MPGGLADGGLWSDRMFIANNPPMGAVINYRLRDYRDEEVKVTIAAQAIDGKEGPVLRKLTGTNRPGLNRVVWDFQPGRASAWATPTSCPSWFPRRSTP